MFSVGSLVANQVRHGSDIDSDVVALLEEVRDGWEPPDEVTENDYNMWKDDPSLIEPRMRAFVGFGCSFGGNKWGKYAKDNAGDRNYALNAKRSLIKHSKNLKGASFRVCSYDDWNPSGMLIYCDPPYTNTTSDSVPGLYHFNPFDFWDLCRYWAKSNIVFASERMFPTQHTEIVSEWDRQKASSESKKGMLERLVRVHPRKITRKPSQIEVEQLLLFET